MAIADEYPARSPPGTADFQITAPVFLFNATNVACGPPGVTTTTSPSIKGDSEYAQVPGWPPNSFLTFFVQTILPVDTCMHAMSPSELNA
jgi:hypothetical protein